MYKIFDSDNNRKNYFVRFNRYINALSLNTY